MDTSPRRAGEEGAVAIIAALTLTVLLLFAAFVIDLGGLRADRSVGQSVADMAATAGGQVYEPRVAGSAREACETAIAYAEINLGVTLSPVGAGCNVFGTTQTCTTATWSPAVYRSGGTEVVVTIPVPDGPGLMQSASYGPEIDGEPCQRIGVSVTQDRAFVLAGAGGAGTDGQTTTSAVARASSTGDLGEFASLIVLDRLGCEVLTSQGSPSQNNEVRVESTTIDGEYYPGIITVDTIAQTTGQNSQQCNTSSRQLIMGGGGGQIFAADHIFSHQLQQNPGTQALTFSGTVNPTPEPGRRITRAPVDHLYNCRSSYPAGERWSPEHVDSVSDGSPCEDAGERPPYITALHGAYHSLTAAPAGWGIITGGQCSNLTGTFGPGAGQTQTRWFVNCTGTSGNQGFTPNNVHFDGVETVVTRGQVRLQNDSLRVTGAAGTGAVLYIQAGGLDAGTGNLNLTDTFVYVHNGPVAATGNVNWRAPLDLTPDDVDTACDTYDDAYDFAGPNGAPPAICFAPLALWTNWPNPHSLGGEGTVTTVGSFFTPNARNFRLVGGSNTDYRQSQFFTARLDVRGGGQVRMVPNPNTNIELPLLGPSLIR